VLSLNANSIDTIENLDGLYIEDLYLQHNRIKKITGLSNLPALKTLDLSKNQITKLKGLSEVETLRFLYLSLNSINKVG
jgi:Leucine-rich repeat (LRR) protein